MSTALFLSPECWISISFTLQLTILLRNRHAVFEEFEKLKTDAGNYVCRKTRDFTNIDKIYNTLNSSYAFEFFTYREFNRLVNLPNEVVGKFFRASSVRSIRLISAISDLPVAIQQFYTLQRKKTRAPLYDSGEIRSLRRSDNRNGRYDFVQLATSIVAN